MNMVENKDEIGAPGYSGDEVGYATRAPHIPIDRKRVRRYDLRRKEMLSLLFWPSLAALALIGGALWSIALLRWWSVLLGLLLLGGAWLAARLLIYPIRGLRSLYELYYDSSLLGAVVVREHPLTVAVLINLDAESREVYRYFDPEGNEITEEAYDEAMAQAEEAWENEWEERYDNASEAEAERMYAAFWEDPARRFTRQEDEAATDAATPWGCKLCVVGEGDWNYRRGDRMPCSSAFGYVDSERGIWTAVNAIPLVWGTNDRGDLQACVEAVSDFEWKLLEELAPEVAELEVDELYMIHRQPDGGPRKFSFELIELVDEEEDEDEDTDEEEDDREA